MEDFITLLPECVFKVTLKHWPVVKVLNMRNISPGFLEIGKIVLFHVFSIIINISCMTSSER